MNLIEKYNKQVLELFRCFKIKSIKINGILYDDYCKIPKDIVIHDIKFNKKYIKLFKNDKFIIENYIENIDAIKKNQNNNKYIYLNISDHSRLRLLTRYMILYLKYRDFLNDKIQAVMQDIVDEYLNYFQDFVFINESKFKTAIHTFITQNRDVFDEAISVLFERSRIIKNLSRKYKRRIEEYGDTNIFLYYPFALIYDVKTNTIKTIEIYHLNKNFTETKGLSRLLNKKVNDYKFLYIQTEKYITTNNNSNRKET